MNTSTPGDRPLSGFQNTLLLAGATATILSFYFLVICSILVLLVIIVAELGIFIALARFGLGRLFVPVVQRHGALLTIFFRSLWLGKSTQFRTAIRRDDSPELYLVLKELCGKAKVPMPRRVYLEMGVNASVQMNGFWRGSGTNILNIGYDLLAGLSQAEMKGVLAHEVMHAKLVQRGFRQLLTGGISRAAKLTNSLSIRNSNSRRIHESEVLTQFFMRGADRLTKRAARQISACSRQDEFAADRGAAELCGAGAIYSSLLKLEGLNRIASRLPLRDRIARLESGEGISQWLVNELLMATPVNPAEAKVEAFNKYSTHPSLHDRLAALSIFPDQTLPESPSAIGLLAKPDEVAEKLVTAIQREVIAQEEKDSKHLDKWTRKGKLSGRMTPLSGIGTMLIIVAIAAGVLALPAGGMSWGLAIGLAVAIGAGFVMRHFGQYKDKIKLPVPDFALIKAVSNKKLDIKEEQVKEIEAAVRQAAIEAKKPKQKVAHYLKQSYAALAECDYVRAHIASRFCLELEKLSIPGTLALAVAAGGLKQGEQVGRALTFVRHHTGMRGDSPAWGAGWALILVSDWIHAEAFLEQARTQKSASATILALLAISQARRGKLFSAIATARKAQAFQPEEKEYAKLLIDFLLEGGFIREANELLQRFVEEAMTDTELAFSMAKLSLMQQHDVIADDWIELIRQSPEGSKKFIAIGETYENARKDAKAEEHFQQALQNGHYPEALVGLGRLEARRENREQAGAYFLAALDLNSPLGENSVGPLPLVTPIIQQLKLLQDPILNCRAWIAVMPAKIKPAVLSGVSFLVYGTDGKSAKTSLHTLLCAMHPGTPPLPNITWKSAPPEQQPDGPVHPGVQGVL